MNLRQLTIVGGLGLLISVLAFTVSPWFGWPVALSCVILVGMLLQRKPSVNGDRSEATITSDKDREEASSLPIVVEQKCRDCGEVKHHTEFARHGTSKTGLRKSCISCVELAHWEEEFTYEVFAYGLDRTNCSWCGGPLVIMAKESKCNAFKICAGQHASYSRMVSYRVGYERADRSVPQSKHNLPCYIARAFPQQSQPTNVIEELSKQCRWPKKIPDRVHYMVSDRGILCGYKYKNLTEEFRSAAQNQVTCKRCIKMLPSVGGNP